MKPGVKTDILEGMAPVQDPRIVELMERRKRRLEKLAVDNEIDHHRHVNKKRLRECCTLDEKSGVVTCSNPKMHWNNPAVGKKTARGMNRRLRGLGQPYHNDLIPGQIRVTPKYIAEAVA